MGAGNEQNLRCWSAKQQVYVCHQLVGCMQSQVPGPPVSGRSWPRAAAPRGGSAGGGRQAQPLALLTSASALNSQAHAQAAEGRAQAASQQAADWGAFERTRPSKKPTWPLRSGRRQQEARALLGRLPKCALLGQQRDHSCAETQRDHTRMRSQPGKTGRQPRPRAEAAARSAAARSAAAVLLRPARPNPPQLLCHNIAKGSM